MRLSTATAVLCVLMIGLGLYDMFDSSLSSWLLKRDPFYLAVSVIAVAIAFLSFPRETKGKDEQKP